MEEKMKSTVISYEAGDFYNCGINLGSLLSEAVLGTKKPIVGSAESKPETLSEADFDVYMDDMDG
jgi:hypothetical protein